MGRRLVPAADSDGVLVFGLNGRLLEDQLQIGGGVFVRTGGDDMENPALPGCLAQLHALAPAGDEVVRLGEFGSPAEADAPRGLRSAEIGGKPHCRGRDRRVGIGRHPFGREGSSLAVEISEYSVAIREAGHIVGLGEIGKDQTAPDDLHRMNHGIERTGHSGGRGPHIPELHIPHQEVGSIRGGSGDVREYVADTRSGRNVLRQGSKCIFPAQLRAVEVVPVVSDSHLVPLPGLRSRVQDRESDWLLAIGGQGGGRAVLSEAHAEIERADHHGLRREAHAFRAGRHKAFPYGLGRHKACPYGLCGDGTQARVGRVLRSHFPARRVGP